MIYMRWANYFSDGHFDQNVQHVICDMLKGFSGQDLIGIRSSEPWEPQKNKTSYEL